MKRLLLAVSVILFAAGFFSSPAFAGHCGRDIRAIDTALTKVKLSKTRLAKVKKLRNKGAALHEKRHHRTSLRALHEAMKILGIEH